MYETMKREYSQPPAAAGHRPARLFQGHPAARARVPRAAGQLPREPAQRDADPDRLAHRARRSMPTATSGASWRSLCGAINGDYGELDWMPVRYIHRMVARKRVPGLCRAAAVGAGDAAARRHEPGGQGVHRGAGPGRSGRAGAVALRRRGRAAQGSAAGQSLRHARHGAKRCSRRCRCRWRSAASGTRSCWRASASRTCTGGGAASSRRCAKRQPTLLVGVNAGGHIPQQAAPGVMRRRASSLPAVTDAKARDGRRRLRSRQRPATRSRRQRADLDPAAVLGSDAPRLPASSVSAHEHGLAEPSGRRHDADAALQHHRAQAPASTDACAAPGRVPERWNRALGRGVVNIGEPRWMRVHRRQCGRLKNRHTPWLLRSRNSGAADGHLLWSFSLATASVFGCPIRGTSTPWTRYRSTASSPRTTWTRSTPARSSRATSCPRCAA